MQRTLTLKSNAAEISVPANLEPVSAARARKQAFKIFGIVWGIGALTVPIPLIHFVAVPVCLFSGPLVGWIVYRMWSKTEEWVADVKCPACGKSSTLKVNRYFDQASRRCSCGATWEIS